MITTTMDMEKKKDLLSKGIMEIHSI